MLVTAGNPLLLMVLNANSKDMNNSMPQTRILLLVFGLALCGISPAVEAQSTVILDDFDPSSSEAGQETAEVTVTRDNGGDTTTRLRVYLTRDGSATIGTDYTTQNLIGVTGNTYYINIEANELSKTVIITPVLEQIEEADETVIFTLLGPGLGGNEYTIGSPSQAEAIILDFRDLVFSDSFETNLERVSPDTHEFSCLETWVFTFFLSPPFSCLYTKTQSSFGCNFTLIKTYSVLLRNQVASSSKLKVWAS